MMKDITLADLQQTTTQTQAAVLATTIDRMTTSVEAQKAHRKLINAHNAYDRLRDQEKTEAAFIKFNSRAPQVLADITKWQQLNPKRVITEFEFDRDALCSWMDQNKITSRTGIERAISRWYASEFRVDVQCWFPFVIDTNWELAMGQTGRLHVGFWSNADRIKMRLTATALLPF